MPPLVSLSVEPWKEKEGAAGEIPEKRGGGGLDGGEGVQKLERGRGGEGGRSANGSVLIGSKRKRVSSQRPPSIPPRLLLWPPDNPGDGGGRRRRKKEKLEVRGTRDMSKKNFQVAPREEIPSMFKKFAPRQGKYVRLRPQPFTEKQRVKKKKKKTIFPPLLRSPPWIQ